MHVVNLTLEFCGGLDSLLYLNKQNTITLPDASEPVTLVSVLQYVDANMLPYNVDRELLFDKSRANVRPGILVLVNDVDWELLQGPKTVLKNGDVISFISSIHGG